MCVYIHLYLYISMCICISRNRNKKNKKIIKQGNLHAYKHTCIHT